MPLSDGLAEEDIRAALDCLAGGWLTMGPRIAALEERFAAELGVEHAIAVSSGTAALHLACLAAGAGPGSSVVVSALAGVAAVNAPRSAGAGALRADVTDPEAPALDPESAADARTVAVICSHLAGVPADAAALADRCAARGWTLIEDVTEGLGARLGDGRPAGTAGALGCFSFAPGGAIAVGEGGMVVARDERHAARVRSLRSHAMTSVTWDRHRGHADTYDIVDIGFNFRLDEPRAAIALSQLDRLGARVGDRRGALEALRAAAPAAPALWDDDALARSSPAAAPLRPADDRVRAALEPHARPWPDGFAGVRGARSAPVADVVRRDALLVDLRAAEPVTAALSRPG